MSNRPLGLVVILGLACGPPHAGEPCRTSGGFQCEDSSTALECRAGTWAAMPCRGAGGCAISLGQVTCDLQGSAEGDLCPLTKENQGLCGPGGLSVLQCREGTLVTTAVCARCSLAARNLLDGGVTWNVVCGT